MATTIYSGSNDGYIVKWDSNWVTARDADTGASFSKTSSSNAYGIRAVISSGRGGTTYFISRSFLEFDVSGITHVPKGAIISIYGFSTDGVGNMLGVKSTQDSSLSINDFDAIEGWETGGVDNITNLTYYTGTISSWGYLNYNIIALTQTALVDIASLSTFKIALLQREYDEEEQNHQQQQIGQDVIQVPIQVQVVTLNL